MKKIKQKTLDEIAGLMVLVIAFANFGLFLFFSIIYYLIEYNPLINLFLSLIICNIFLLIIFGVYFFNHQIKEVKL